MLTLQGLKQQYTTELAQLQEASQAAAEALRQRLRRLTSERTGKSPTAAAAATAGGGAGFTPSAPNAAVPASSTAAYVPASMPRSDSIQSSASIAGTAAPATLPASWSTSRLSDSWGSSSAAPTNTAQQSDFASIPQYQSNYAAPGTEQEPPQFAADTDPVPFSDSRLAQAEQPSVQQSMQSTQSTPRTASDARPPKPASSFQPNSFAEQQPSGRQHSMDAASTQSGVTPNQMGRKVSLMSAGSGYQADSDSNSDTQVEPSTLSRLTGSSTVDPQDALSSSLQSGTNLQQDFTQEGKAEQPPSTSDDSTQVSKEAETAEDAEPESSSLLGRVTQLVGNAAWGIAHPIQAAEAVIHPHETSIPSGESTQEGHQPSQDAEQAPEASVHDSAQTSKEAEAAAETEPESPSLLGRATQLVGNTVWSAAHPIQAAEAVTHLLTGQTTDEDAAAEDKPEAAAKGVKSADSGDQEASGFDDAFGQGSQTQHAGTTSLEDEGTADAVASQQPLRAESGYESDVDLPGKGSS